jgi:hypothetical protein
MPYVKLSERELKQAYTLLKAYFEQDEAAANQVRELIAEYYPASAHSVLLKFDSEFTDEDYFHLARAVVVYDKHGNEIEPKPGKKIDLEHDLQNCTFEDSDEPREDLAFTMKAPKLPELYSKKDE